MTWDGTERRKREARTSDKILAEKTAEKTDEVHNVVIEMGANFKNFLEVFKTHVINDEKQFDIVNIKFEKMTDDVTDLKKYLWMAMGAIVLIEFISKFIK